MTWQGDPQRRLRAARGWLGYRSARFVVSTGALVVVLDGDDTDHDTEAGRWQVVCDDHGSLLSQETLALANSAALEPEEWCDGCRSWVALHECG